MNLKYFGRLKKYEPLKKFFNLKEENEEVKMLEVKVRMLQNALNMEEEHHKHAKSILLNIVECEKVKLPIPIALEVFDYLNIEKNY